MGTLAWIDLIGPFFAWSLVVLAIGYTLGRNSAGRSDLTEPPPGTTAPRRALNLPSEIEAEIEAALRDNRKIEAIKILRDASDMDLKEAKEAIEARTG